MTPKEKAIRLWNVLSDETRDAITASQERAAVHRRKILTQTNASDANTAAEGNEGGNQMDDKPTQTDFQARRSAAYSRLCDYPLKQPIDGKE